MKRLCAAVAFFVFALAPHPGLARQARSAPTAGPGGVSSAEALAQALDARYKTIRDFSADFVQTYRGGALRTQSKESGTVKIRKPGLMRWLYSSPEKKEFVSDGHSIYSYFPADRQVMVSRVPSDLESTTPALFLAGKADIARDFVAEFAPSPVEGTAGLKLTPRKPEANVDYFVVAVERPSLRIRGLTARDAQGGDSTLIFSNLKENQGISDKEFAFRIPKGVDVITNGSSR
jgi:outer membrane lipoprotein carrier protein